MCTGHTPAISSAEASMEHDSTVYVGLDVHKESITAAYAVGMGEVELLGKIGTTKTDIDHLCKRLQSKARHVNVVYEAGPSGVSGGAKPPLNGGENALLWVRPRSHPIPVFCPFAASRIRCAKLRLPLTPLRDILLKRCSKIVPGKHTPPFSGGFRPPFTARQASAPPAP